VQRHRKIRQRSSAPFKTSRAETETEGLDVKNTGLEFKDFRSNPIHVAGLVSNGGGREKFVDLLLSRTCTKIFGEGSEIPLRAQNGRGHERKNGERSRGPKKLRGLQVYGKTENLSFAHHQEHPGYCYPRPTGEDYL